MERSESSDSDSNSSTSWVFVPDNSSPVENNTNAFHLDCSREPIQELTEQDLVSAGSESESDGISVISESDATNGEYESKNCETTSESTAQCETPCGDISILKKINSAFLMQVKKCLRRRNMVGVGVVLTAVFLGSYSLKRVTEKQEEDFFVNNDLEKEDQSSFLHKNSASLGKHVEEIVDITIACTYSKKESKVLKNKIKQCVKDRYEANVLNSNDYQKDEFVEAVHLDSNGIEKLAGNKVDKDKPSKFKKNKKKIDSKRLHKNFESLKGSRLTSKPTLTNKKFQKERPSKAFKEFKSNSVKKILNKQNRTSRENQAKTGEWYTNLHNARHHLRKQHSDDAVYANKKLKNKWYFKWMGGRQELRRKNIYRPYSKNLNM